MHIHLYGYRSITGSRDMNSGKLWAMVREKKAWGAAVRGVTKSQTGLGG